MENSLNGIDWFNLLEKVHKNDLLRWKSTPQETIEGLGYLSVCILDQLLEFKEADLIDRGLRAGYILESIGLSSILLGYPPSLLMSNRWEVGYLKHSPETFSIEYYGLIKNAKIKDVWSNGTNTPIQLSLSKVYSRFSLAYPLHSAFSKLQLRYKATLGIE